MILALLRGNWKVAFIALAVVAVLGFIGNLQLTIARQGRQINDLLEEQARSVPAATKAELEAVRKAIGREIAVQVEGLHETIKAIPRGKDTIFIRETSRPGPPGKPGAPGPPGKPGTPLISTADQPKAREEAIERILAWFDLGTLVNCDTVGLPPSTVEFLRQPGGRILSTASCVFRISDEILVRSPAVTVVKLPHFFVYPLGIAATISGRSDYRPVSGVSYRRPAWGATAEFRLEYQYPGVGAVMLLGWQF